MVEDASQSRPRSTAAVRFRGVSVSAGRVVMAAVRWYLRYGLSYRDAKELLDVTAQLAEEP